VAAAGRAAALDLTRSQALVEQSRASLPQLEAERRAALFRLAALTGRPAADIPAEAERCATPPRLTRPLPVGDGAALLRRRPDVRQAERQLAAATARIGVATADLYPTISLGGSVGSIGLVQHFLAPATNAFGIGPSLTWSPNQSAARARIRGASAAADQALARFDGVVLTSLRETETALDTYAKALERDAILRAQRDQAQQALDQTRTLYQAGKLGFLPVLDAQRQLAAAESALAASETQLSANQVAIFLALGGGWSDE
jgi:outer membrane protein TolC